MEIGLFVSNLTNPTLLFFGLGLLAATLKSDLEIPAASIKFISLYLLLSIGFKGGQELAHSAFTLEILYAILFGLTIASLVPLYTFYILRKRLGVADAGAIAAAYGSVSAVTFVAAASFLETYQHTFSGYMVAVMAFMESPAIVIAVFLINKYDKQQAGNTDLGKILGHSFTNGSVFLILGSLLIGYLADAKQAEGIKPFTTDIFKGFLAIFLLEMGMVTARRFSSFRKYGLYLPLFGILVAACNGSLVALASVLVTNDPGTRFMFAILGAGASYIAVPAAMRMAAPKADPGLYIPMALGVAFPFNISVGMVLYWYIIQTHVSERLSSNLSQLFTYLHF
ncbi:sodium-dependent bicarbonate transport family permease [Rhodocytophaga rosea]|uniref:Sodium-dependent bicarbonate transport family permease n=1 Tax=Rhodocytophaga rosea TaxID=2704465 RepID=A0A6C0GTE6_9BACT|nr:sodium-dependent bicarbonate transport family permease [Rhodocytophaga rosea]QHT67334.1 sodium-dependent bicarbonate transport family permease [Rhodocytophaga rosea]QHT70803.1 sodium-dependent bicarbonate transport family permease [Rhodocytophaga rosea]